MNPSPLSIVEDEVRELVRRQGLDPSRDGPALLSSLVDEVIGDYETRTQASSLPRISDRDTLKRRVLDRVAGLGPLQPLLDDPAVEEIWINGPGRVFCVREGYHQLTSILLNDGEIRHLVERMLRASGRRLDLSMPFVDATLTDGSRLHVAIPDITRKHWAVNVRKFVLRAHRLEELVRLGSLDQPAADFLEASVKAGLNIVVGGGTQSGKTTLLNCLAVAIPPSERVITCEEVFELQINLPDVVGMQTRQPNLEGRGEIDLRRLIVESLRMRPDRLIVGEVRQKEALDLLIALNSGLPGMTSIHANSATEAVRKLTTLPLLAGENVSHSFVIPAVAGSVDLVVHLSQRSGKRRVEEIRGLTGRTEGDTIESALLWERTPDGLRWTGLQPPRRERFQAAGIELEQILT
ncbi:MAG: CpaF family protein [Actinobacteria bacterium]|nr:CpaF family protein [Actinomycetota bacterium]